MEARGGDFEVRDAECHNERLERITGRTLGGKEGVEWALRRGAAGDTHQGGGGGCGPIAQKSAPTT